MSQGEQEEFFPPDQCVLYKKSREKMSALKWVSLILMILYIYRNVFVCLSMFRHFSVQNVKGSGEVTTNKHQKVLLVFGVCPSVLFLLLWSWYISTMLWGDFFMLKFGFQRSKVKATVTLCSCVSDPPTGTFITSWLKHSLGLKDDLIRTWRSKVNVPVTKQNFLVSCERVILKTARGNPQMFT